jgi:pimeloyl-ACP methyl ester carboxylesterase
MPVVEINGCSFGYLGPPPEQLQKKYPLLLLHGACCNSLLWKYQVQSLNADGINTVALDLPGHGDSGGSSSGFIESYAHAIASLADHMQWKMIFLAGHSMGGAVAMTFARLYPERVAGLGLLCTGARLRVAPIIFQLLEESKEKAIDFTIESLASDKMSEKGKDLLKQVMSSVSSKAALDDFTACENFNIMSNLQELDFPTRAMVGENDFATPPKYSHYLADNLPECELEIIDGAGHMLMIEQPDMVSEWLKKVVNPAF